MARAKQALKGIRLFYSRSISTCTVDGHHDRRSLACMENERRAHLQRNFHARKEPLPGLSRGERMISRQHSTINSICMYASTNTISFSGTALHRPEHCGCSECSASHPSIGEIHCRSERAEVGAELAELAEWMERLERMERVRRAAVGEQA